MAAISSFLKLRQTVITLNEQNQIRNNLVKTKSQYLFFITEIC